MEAVLGKWKIRWKQQQQHLLVLLLLLLVPVLLLLLLLLLLVAAPPPTNYVCLNGHMNMGGGGVRKEYATRAASAGGTACSEQARGFQALCASALESMLCQANLAIGGLKNGPQGN